MRNWVQWNSNEYIKNDPFAGYPTQPIVLSWSLGCHYHSADSAAAVVVVADSVAVEDECSVGM